ncbi:MAG: hypothetical protein HRU70_04865 [Phycisphaeraceae bacterium]|nr:MAG: hypothetical protein HRU70_04865 [Phycisphaeraceae bacterium]
MLIDRGSMTLTCGGVSPRGAGRGGRGPRGAPDGPAWDGVPAGAVSGDEGVGPPVVVDGPGGVESPGVLEDMRGFF